MLEIGRVFPAKTEAELMRGQIAYGDQSVLTDEGTFTFMRADPLLGTEWWWGKKEDVSVNIRTSDFIILEINRYRT